MKKFIVSIDEEAEQELLVDGGTYDRPAELSTSDIKCAIIVGLTDQWRSAARAEVIGEGLEVTASRDLRKLDKEFARVTSLFRRHIKATDPEMLWEGDWSDLIDEVAMGLIPTDVVGLLSLVVHDPGLLDSYPSEKGSETPAEMLWAVIWDELIAAYQGEEVSK